MNGLLLHYQFFVIIALISRYLDLNNIQDKFDLFQTIPLFMLSYVNFLFPFMILISLFEVDPDIYWRMFEYYSIILTIVIFVLSVASIVCKKKHRDTLVKFVIRLFKHHRFTFLFSIIYCIDEVVSGYRDPLDFTMLAVFILNLPFLLRLIFISCKELSFCIFNGFEDKNMPLTSTIYKDLRFNSTLAVMYHWLVTVRSIIIAGCTLCIVLVLQHPFTNSKYILYVV